VPIFCCGGSVAYNVKKLYFGFDLEQWPLDSVFMPKSLCASCDCFLSSLQIRHLRVLSFW
jgi:hypothetical protein